MYIRLHPKKHTSVCYFFTTLSITTSSIAIQNIQLKNEMTLFMTLMQFANCINVMKIVIVIYLNMCTINISLPFPCNSKADGSELYEN